MRYIGNFGFVDFHQKIFISLQKGTIMLSVNGIYNGKTVKITDRITEKKKFKVVVTFIEELQQDDSDLRNFSAQTNGLDFLEDAKEDIYQDYLTPKSKVK
jgi:hypothetical protein